jgi:WD40 repeat protein
MTDPRQLIHAYLDGDLTPEQETELRAWLEADRENVRTFVRETHAHRLLRDIIVAQAVQASIGDEALAEKAPASRPKLVRWAGWLSGVAACAALAVGIYYVRSGSRNTPLEPIARLTQVAGDVYVVGQGGRTSARAGHDLFTGQGIEIGGGGSRAVVEYPDSTRLELGPDTIVSSLSGGKADKKVVLAQCVLSAKIAKQANDRPMVLATPDAEVAVADTELTVVSEPSSLRPTSARGLVPTPEKVESKSIIGVGKGTVRVVSKGDNKAIELSEGNYAVVSSGCDMTPQPMTAPINAVRSTLLGHKGPVWYAAFAPDGTLLASTGEDRTLKLWSVSGASEPVTLENCTDVTYFCVAFSPDGKLLAAGKGDTKRQKRPAEIKVWDVATREVRFVLSVAGAETFCLMFSPDSQTLAAAYRTADVELWDMETGQKKASLPETRRVECLAFSPDGSLLALGGRDKTVRLWDVATNTERAKFEGHTNDVWSVAFSPDGKLLASGGADKLVKVWDLAAEKEMTTLEGHTDQIWSVAFSRDGKTLATSSWDKTIKLWKTDTWLEQTTLKAHTNKIWCIAFAPDGKTLASASEDWTVKIWERAGE